MNSKSKFIMTDVIKWEKLLKIFRFKGFLERLSPKKPDGRVALPSSFQRNTKIRQSHWEVTANEPEAPWWCGTAAPRNFLRNKRHRPILLADDSASCCDRDHRQRYFGIKYGLKNANMSENGAYPSGSGAKRIGANGYRPIMGLNNGGKTGERSLEARNWGDGQEKWESIPKRIRVSAPTAPDLGYCPLAISMSAFPASGFRANIVSGFWFSASSLAQSCFGLNPILVQSPDDCCPTDPLRLTPLLFGFFPIINRKNILFFLRKITCSFQLSSGFISPQRVIADWSPVGLNPSDDSYMPWFCESLQIETGDLSTDADLSCGKTVAGMWTTRKNRNRYPVRMAL
tara:strand:- start:2018 stop:3046 length:1029 start_codon:yes stop_codon:yes gene_type:complete